MAKPRFSEEFREVEKHSKFRRSLATAAGNVAIGKGAKETKPVQLLADVATPLLETVTNSPFSNTQHEEDQQLEDTSRYGVLAEAQASASTVSFHDEWNELTLDTSSIAEVLGFSKQTGKDAGHTPQAPEF